VFSFYKVSWRTLSKGDKLTNQVYAILDEVFLAGEIEETSKQVVLDRLDYLEKLE
jgi:AP-2 complex subunit sigma-1